jgi:hypothetical protein
MARALTQPAGWVLPGGRAHPRQFSTPYHFFRLNGFAIPDTLRGRTHLRRSEERDFHGISFTQGTVTGNPRLSLSGRIALRSAIRIE